MVRSLPFPVSITTAKSCCGCSKSVSRVDCEFDRPRICLARIVAFSLPYLDGWSADSAVFAKDQSTSEPRWATMCT